MKETLSKTVHCGIYSTMLSSPTRSGKGASNVVPALLTYSGNIKGRRFNPVMEIRTGEDEFSGANLIAGILTTPVSGGGNATNI